MPEPHLPCAPPPQPDTEALRRARAILRDRASVPTPAELCDMAERLKDGDRFSYARRILELARSRPVRDPDLANRLRERHALCMSKDTDLPLERRLERALAILRDGTDLGTTTRQETLGLAGAIHKRQWQVDMRRESLETALHYYRRGHAVGPESDGGYNGINAAFILDQLASLEEDAARAAGASSGIAAARRDEARSVRARLVELLPGLPERAGHEDLSAQWWYHATLIEAWFGLGDYERAAQHIRLARDLTDAAEWEFRSTAEQLAALARLLPGVPGDVTALERSPAGIVLRQLLREGSAGVRSAGIGRTGLALSGGGFRASLYHIGVLAALAELDVLRHVEVLSCVSGGSIVGAHYYLEARHLLETKEDDRIEREDYIEIVKRIEARFLEGVQRNIRMRVIGSPASGVRMIFSRRHSRTARAGELFEKHLFSRVDDGNGNAPRWMADLLVHPLGDRHDFRPRRDNWRRAAKVPDLVLNATTLNTGHNWRFTASWMGEAPARTEGGIDTSYRLRRMYWSEAPAGGKCVRLGHAVAASACVPGLFEPLSLEGLYPDRIVRLVDGGVHDNQGVAALLEEDCNVILVSDASGQMGTVDAPAVGPLSVPLRSNAILMKRVRTAQFDELHARYRSKLLRGLMFVHLRQGLEGKVMDWVGCDDAGVTSASEPVNGASPDMLERLSSMRTDLDAFSDAEAFSLMYTGWRMTRDAFESRSLEWMPHERNGRVDWAFQQIESHLGVPSRTQRLMRLLDAGRHRTFRVWRLSWPTRIAGIGILLAAAVLLTWLLLTSESRALVTTKTVAVVLIGAAAIAAAGSTVRPPGSPTGSLWRIVTGLGLAGIGWLMAGLHLAIADPLFLWLGRVRAVRSDS